jgi:hypothetical protein
MDHDFESAAFDFFRFTRVGEVARGQDERTGGKDFSAPVVRECEVNRGAHIQGVMMILGEIE